MILPAGRSFELTWELLRGAIDIHVHAGPHLFSSPRRVDPFEAATEARDAGMRAIVFMDVFEMSNGTAWLVSRAVPDMITFGGLILNTVYGGMNPRAVKTAIHYGAGAKFVSFGAHSTYFQASHEGRVVDGKFVPLSELYPEFKREELDRCIRIPEGDPTPELDEILRLIADNPHMYLNTGHVSVEEAMRLVELAEHYGITKVLVASSVSKIATLDDLATWRIQRISHRGLIRSAWRHRHNLTAYDALYVATARVLHASLITADGPLSRAPNLEVPIHNVRLGETS
jgi:predicted nucleic acid-binding protein